MMESIHKAASRASLDPEKPYERDETSSTGSESPAKPALEKRVWLKLDLWILPVVTMFYLLSFLDRVNLGNARVAGLQKDLNMTNTQYSIALTITYVPYLIAELPSNLLLKAVGPNWMLPTMLTFWGVVTTFQGIISSYKGLLIARFFLGLLEGGVLPSLVLYLSFFYPRQRLQWSLTEIGWANWASILVALIIMSIFFSAASISGAFSGLLAFCIIKMHGIGGKPGWAWIFILEGLFTVLFGASSFFLLPRSPAHVRFFSTEEKEYVVAKLREDGAMGRDDEDDAFSWREVGMAFRLPQVWMLAVISFMAGTALYGLAYFTPSIVQGLGYTAAKAQLHSVPPFAAAFVVTLLGALISDRYGCRGFVTMLAFSLCIIGFGLFLGSEKHTTQYASLFFSIPGMYLSAPCITTWIANNAAPHTRRATAIAISPIMTNFGGILATWLLGELSPAPRYVEATRVLLAFSVIMLVLTGLNTLYLWDQNKRKKVIRENTKRSEEKPGLGDRSAWFVYAL